MTEPPTPIATGTPTSSVSAEPFAGFRLKDVATSRGPIRVRVGGSGPPLLLLHGYPQTHMMWHSVAPLLAECFTVIAADLPGYGDSFRPPPSEDHASHSKRALASDLADAMAQLGHNRFAVAGHDRGGRVAYRMAFDRPELVGALAVLDVVPTGEVWARADAVLTLTYWHWAFLAQPAPLPERMIAGAPDAFFDLHVRALGLGGAPGRYPAGLMADYRRVLDDPSTVEAICEDYRAGAGIDRDHDDADRGERRIECPLLVLWSARGALPRLYGDVLEIWRPWARNVTGRGIEASHFLVEDRPEDVANELTCLLAYRAPASPLRTTHQEPAMSTDAMTDPQPRDDLAGKLKRTELQHAASSIPGRDIVQVLTEIPAGVQSGWHQHPGEEVGYIIAGTVRMEIEGKPTLTLNAGDPFLIPPRTPHNALDVGPDTGHMLSTYIVEVGEPIATFTTP